MNPNANHVVVLAHAALQRLCPRGVGAGGVYAAVEVVGWAVGFVSGVFSSGRGPAVFSSAGRGRAARAPGKAADLQSQNPRYRALWW